MSFPSSHGFPAWKFLTPGKGVQYQSPTPPLFARYVKRIPELLVIKARKRKEDFSFARES